ncbi:MAG TPA: amino acid adenylation domain-containing protein [Ktedonobacterales bacterium]|jgi:aspartate racemase
MSMAEFLGELSQRGISIWVDGDNLRYRATRDALTPALREELRQRKAEILAYLRPASQQANIPRPLLPAKREGVLPLSFSQERLWFLQQLEPESYAYVEPHAMKLVGQVQREALEKSLNAVVHRHENLRTTFVSVQGRPCQVIAPTVHLPLPVFDLMALSEEERQAEAQRLFAEAGCVTFDLGRGPLLHLYLLRLGPEEHILLTTLHHVIADRASGNLFLNELTTFYAEYSKTTDQQLPPSLPELPIQYADYALWQRERLQGEALAHHRDYWRQQLAGVPPLLELPTDFPRPTVKRYGGSHLGFELPATLQGLRALSAREGATLFMTLLAAFQTLLMRYSGQDDIVVGTSITSRTRLELEPLIGLFINTLVLRSDLSGNPTFRQLLQRVRSVCLSAYEHQELPFEKLVEELQPERNLSYSPLYQVAFSLEHAPGTAIKLPGLTWESISWANNTSKFDLSLTLVETPTALLGRLEYNTDLFTPDTIIRLARHFQTLLESIVANPDQQLADLPMLNQAERAQMLGEWDHPPTPLPTNRCLHTVFEDRVTERPDAIALVLEDQQLTYAELNTRANQLAHHLRELGVGPEVRVGLCLDRSVEAIIGLLGILKAGGAYVPLDPYSPRERLAFMLADSLINVVLTQRQWRSQFAVQGAQAYTLCSLDSDWELVAQQKTANGSWDVLPDNLAYVLYTSGSTGQPKGVLITHAQVAHYVYACLSDLGLAACTRFALVQPLTVDSTVTLLYSSLFLGQTLHLFSREQALDAIGLNEAFRAQSIDCLKIAPSHLRALQTVAGESLLPRQRLIIGGEASSWEWVHGLAAKHPGCQVINHYGPTETTVGVLIYPVPREISTNEPAYSTTPLGRPLPRIQAYILDARFEPVPIGVPGELYIGGDGLARGYLNRPDLTAERFVPHPFSRSPGARLYRTGDLVRARPNGVIEFIGRRDEQIKLHGFRIELGEIEGVLISHPAVSQALITLREDTPGDQRLVAYVVQTEASAGPSPAELRQHAQELLPDYMVPAAFVVLEKLPLTPHGKLNQQALPPPDWAAQSALPAVPPRTVTETKLAVLWGQVLHRDSVGIHDNFFELGGHSLLATQLMARIFDTFHSALPLRTLFEAPTIARFALRLEEYCQQPDTEKQPEVMPFVQRARYRGPAGQTTRTN